MPSKWTKDMKDLQKLEGAVVDRYDPFLHTIMSPSPSVNYIYGNTWGQPQQYTEAVFGEPKCGKSIMLNAKIGQMHRDDDEAIALKFETEFREEGQLTDDAARLYGIDRDRLLTWSVNRPDQIFDRIENEVAEKCEKGMPIRHVSIDSIGGIQGRRMLNADSIMKQQIGDLALTLQEGFKRILPVQRKYRFAVTLCAQVRAEMDENEIKRGHRVKIAAAFGVKHYAEYFVFVEKLLTAASRKDELGRELVGERKAGLGSDAPERTAHKTRVTMRDTSFGAPGRSGVFTWSYRDGIINTHEEVFKLAYGFGVIELSGKYYAFGDKKWSGKPAILDAIKNDPALYKQILNETRKADMEGRSGVGLDESAEDGVPAAEVDLDTVVQP